MFQLAVSYGDIRLPNLMKVPTEGQACVAELFHPTEQRV